MADPTCSFHVAIIGAGLGGVAAAIGLLRTGHRVTMIEQASALSEVWIHNFTSSQTSLTENCEHIGAGIQVPPNASRASRR